MDSLVKKGRLQGGEDGQAKRNPRRSRMKHEQVSGCKSSPGRSSEVSLPSQVKPEVGKEVGRQRTHS